jgi:hypothetical protein
MELYGTYGTNQKALQINDLRCAVLDIPRLATFARELYQVKKELCAPRCSENWYLPVSSLITTKKSVDKCEKKVYTGLTSVGK